MTTRIILFLIISASCLLGAGRQEMDSVLAAVNGDPITLGEIVPALREQEFRLTRSYSGVELEQRILALRRKAVDEAIDRKLIIADFSAQKLTIPSQEVENEIDRWGKLIGCHSRKDLEDRLKKSGTQIEKIRTKIRERMIVQIMRHREFILATPPSPAELLKRFKKMEKKLSRPGQVEIALLKIDKKEKEKIRSVASELKKDPASWQKFLPLYAISRRHDGSVGVVDMDKLRPEFAKAMKNISPGKIYSEVVTADGVYFIKVIVSTPPRKAVFRDHVESIKKNMEDEIYRKSSADYAARLRDQAVIEYFFSAVGEGEKK